MRESRQALEKIENVVYFFVTRKMRKGESTSMGEDGKRVFFVLSEFFLRGVEL